MRYLLTLSFGVQLSPSSNMVLALALLVKIQPCYGNNSHDTETNDQIHWQNELNLPQDRILVESDCPEKNCI